MKLLKMCVLLTVSLGGMDNKKVITIVQNEIETGVPFGLELGNKYALDSYFLKLNRDDKVLEWFLNPSHDTIDLKHLEHKIMSYAVQKIELDGIKKFKRDYDIVTRGESSRLLKPNLKPTIAEEPTQKKDTILAALENIKAQQEKIVRLSETAALQQPATQTYNKLIELESKMGLFQHEVCKWHGGVARHLNYISDCFKRSLWGCLAAGSLFSSYIAYKFYKYWA